MRLILPFFLIFLLISCANKTEEKVQETREMLRGVKIIETKMGRKSWELHAERIDEESDTTLVYNFVLYFFDENGKRTSELWADSGVVFQERGDMKALGNVRVFTVEGDTLFTSSLMWREDIKRIICDSPVTLISKGKVLRGKGLVSDAKLSKVEIKGQVEGESER